MCKQSRVRSIIRTLEGIQGHNHAKKQDLVRVIDESGEDYLFPSDYFVPVALPKVVQDAMMRDAH